MREWKVLAALLCLLQIAAAGTIANAAEGSAKRTRTVVTGMATDALGRPMEGVRVILQTNDGQIFGRSVSDKGGHFAFSNVAPGFYELVANKADFKTALAVVTVTAAGAKPVELAMEAQTALSLQRRAPKSLTTRATNPSAAAGG
jgi:protocatechuate 3,4-dioxygenase beta subunit